MAKTAEEKFKEACKLVASHAGMAGYLKHGKKYMSDKGKLGAQKRWGKRSVNKDNK